MHTRVVGGKIFKTINLAFGFRVYTTRDFRDFGDVLFVEFTINHIEECCYHPY
jgi:hypothetical protein